MELKRGKVYKIRHNRTTIWRWDRDYIICSPVTDVRISDEELSSKWSRFSFYTYFIVGFDSNIYIRTDEHIQTTVFFWDCTLEEIIPSDYQDIRRVIDKYNTSHNNKMLYNRKKNCLVFK